MSNFIQAIIGASTKTNSVSIVDMRFFPALSNHLKASILKVSEPSGLKDVLEFDIMAGGKIYTCYQYRDGMTLVTHNKQLVAEIVTRKSGASVIRSNEGMSYYREDGAPERIERSDGTVEHYDNDGNLAGVQSPLPRQLELQKAKTPLIALKKKGSRKCRRSPRHIAPPQLGKKIDVGSLKKPLISAKELAAPEKAAPDKTFVAGTIAAVNLAQLGADRSVEQATRHALNGLSDFVVVLPTVSLPVIAAVSKHESKDGVSERMASDSASALEGERARTEIASALLFGMPFIGFAVDRAEVGRDLAVVNRFAAPKESALASVSPLSMMTGSPKTIALPVGNVFGAVAFVQDGQVAGRDPVAFMAVPRSAFGQPTVRPPLGARIFSPIAFGRGSRPGYEGDARQIKYPQFPGIPTAAPTISRKPEVHEPEMIARADFKKTDDQPDDERERRQQHDDEDQNQDEEQFV